jgi:hypothetical protein
MRASIAFASSCLIAGFIACSDDDGANIVPNGPPGTGGGGAGGTPTAGSSGSGGSGGAGTGGSAGSPGGGSGGSAGCMPVTPDAGADAGLSDAGRLDAGADGGELDASAASGLVSFAADIHPIFEAACNPCHVSVGYGGHNVGGELDQAYEDAVRLGVTLVQRIDGGGMPPPDAEPPYDCGAEGRPSQPGDEGCLTVAQVALVQTWIDQCYPR